MIYIGVDPGKKGGYTILTHKGVLVFPWDESEFVEDLRSISGNPCIAAVEKVGAMHGQGVTSMFSFGRSAGYIEGVLTALGIPFQLVPPSVWKKEFSLIGKDKAASIQTCKRLFPGINLLPTEKCVKDSDGMAESTLLAEYARRKM